LLPVTNGTGAPHAGPVINPFDSEVDMTPQEIAPELDDIPGPTGREKDAEPLAKEAAAADAQPVTDAPADHEPTQLVALLEDARAKADSHWDQLLRARAELENLQRRQARELENAHKYALEGFVREMVLVRDSLELGYDAAHSEGADLDKLREGTELTLKLMADTMVKFGVDAVDPHGEAFNPEFHQAMTMVPRDDLPPNTVVTVVQKGYVLNGRLVRPAMVIVSRKS
jgi:molecular chaperone GrpE